MKNKEKYKWQIVDQDVKTSLLFVIVPHDRITYLRKKRGKTLFLIVFHLNKFSLDITFKTQDTTLQKLLYM